MKKVLKAIGKITLLLGIYLISQIVTSLLFGLGYEFALGFEVASSGAQINAVDVTERITQFLTTYTPLIFLTAAVVAGLFYILVYRRKKEEAKQFCAFRKPNVFHMLSLIVLGISLKLIIGFVLSLLSSVGSLSSYFESYSNLSETIMSGQFVLSLIAVGIVIPIFEEILFRGFIQGELKKISAAPVAIILQAVIFGVYHFNIIQGAYAIVIGLILGCIYYRSKSILYPMLVHISINTSSIIFSKVLSEVQLEQYSTVILITSAVLFVASEIVVVMSKGFKSVPKEEPSESNAEMPVV